MMRFVATLICWLVGLSAANSQALDSMMMEYEINAPIEKVHLHFDKNIYNKDETIFYKAYLRTGNDMSRFSKNLYVEWYDTTGRIIKQSVAPVFQSSAKGAFEIPASYTGNFIHVKAYTTWMLNHDTDFVFKKDILINAPVNLSPKLTAPIELKTTVQAFPEGGTAVAGLPIRFAFRATNPYGDPVKIRGALVDSKMKKVDTLITKHDGMGMFSFTPVANENYQLNWIDENGKKGSTPIEKPKIEGVNIQVQGGNEQATVKIQRTENIPANWKKLNLWIHQHQSLYYKVSINVTEKRSVIAQIPIDELPTGILQFTLFSEDFLPVAERILFVNNREHEFNVRVTFPLVNLEKRGKNVVEFFVPDTAAANLSVAITDYSLNTPETQTIFSDLLLSSDIKGKIHNPGYYLMSDSDSVTANLDLVLLTHGWRRFNWDKLKAGVPPAISYPVEQSFIKLQGKVFGLKPNMSAAPPQLNLIMTGKDSSKQFYFAPVNRDGSFEVADMFFYDTAKVYYNFNSGNKLTEVTQVRLDNGLLRYQPGRKTFLDKNPITPYADSILRVRMTAIFNEQERLRKMMQAATLQEVVVKAKTKTNLQILEEKFATGLFSGGDGYAFDIGEDAKIMGAIDVLTFLQGRVAGLMISGSGANATLNWRGSVPDLYLNEIRAQIDMIQTINIQDIAFVKVFRPPFFGSGGGGAGGAIAIYTKRGQDTRKADPNAKGMEYAILGGYSRFKEFAQPPYDKPETVFDPDNRTTILWNPYILTNKKSPRIKLTYYNNDFSKKLLLVLEGMNSEGKLVRVVKPIDPTSQD
ncbi:MAG: hypothetical protein ACK55T_01395 [Bacteroidota bacterium]|jgi:hypothetical protein